MDIEWRFAESKNVAVITLRQILSQAEPILHVSYDGEDGVWQFLGRGNPKEEDAKIVALSEIVQLDPSVQEVADLPSGWHARRRSVDEPWQRSNK